MSTAKAAHAHPDAEAEREHGCDRHQHRRCRQRHRPGEEPLVPDADEHAVEHEHQRCHGLQHGDPPQEHRGERGHVGIGVNTWAAPATAPPRPRATRRLPTGRSRSGDPRRAAAPSPDPSRWPIIACAAMASAPRPMARALQISKAIWWAATSSPDARRHRGQGRRASRAGPPSAPPGPFRAGGGAGRGGPARAGAVGPGVAHHGGDRPQRRRTAPPPSPRPTRPGPCRARRSGPPPARGCRRQCRPRLRAACVSWRPCR